MNAAATQAQSLAVAQKLLLNGCEVLHGNGKLGVIYNILAGHLIKDSDGFRQYLAHLEEDWGPIRPGDRITLIANNARVVRCEIGAPDAPVYTDQLQYDVLLSQFEKLELEISQANAQHEAELLKYQRGKHNARSRPPVPSRMLLNLETDMQGSPFKRGTTGGIVVRDGWSDLSDSE